MVATHLLGRRTVVVEMLLMQRFRMVSGSFWMSDHELRNSPLPNPVYSFGLALTLYLDLQIRAPTRLTLRAQRQALPVEPGCR